MSFGLTRNINRCSYAWLSKSWSLSGAPKYFVPYYAKEPTRDNNFDNHPYGLSVLCAFSAPGRLRVPWDRPEDLQEVRGDRSW